MRKKKHRERCGGHSVDDWLRASLGSSSSFPFSQYTDCPDMRLITEKKQAFSMCKHFIKVSLNRSTLLASICSVAYAHLTKQKRLFVVLNKLMSVQRCRVSNK